MGQVSPATVPTKLRRNSRAAATTEEGQHKYHAYCLQNAGVIALHSSSNKTKLGHTYSKAYWNSRWFQYQIKKSYNT
jgi:hypothetical protein